jgi:hypothetical protein
VIERRQHLRFALEAVAPFGIGKEGLRQDLDRNAAVQLGVARAVDLAL